MFTSARSAQVAINGDTMNYLVFGQGSKTLVILPGLSDGLAPVHGQFQALSFAFSYRLIAQHFKVICSAAGIRCPQSIPRGKWLPIRLLP